MLTTCPIDQLIDQYGHLFVLCDEFDGENGKRLLRRSAPSLEMYSDLPVIMQNWAPCVPSRIVILEFLGSAGTSEFTRNDGVLGDIGHHDTDTTLFTSLEMAQARAEEITKHVAAEYEELKRNYPDLAAQHDPKLWQIGVEERLLPSEMTFFHPEFFRKGAVVSYFRTAVDRFPLAIEQGMFDTAIVRVCELAGPDGVPLRQHRMFTSMHIPADPAFPTDNPMQLDHMFVLNNNGMLQYGQLYGEAIRLFASRIEANAGATEFAQNVVTNIRPFMEHVTERQARP